MIKTDIATIAENPEEKFWEELKNKMLKDIDTNEKEITISKHIIELCKKKLETFK